MKHDPDLLFIRAILQGKYGMGGVKGDNDHETMQMRAEWAVKMLPKTSGLVGVEWDGLERLSWRE